MRRARQRWIGAALLGLGLAALLAAHTWFFKPLSIDWFYARTFARLALHNESAELTRASLATLLRYDRDTLDREGQLAYDTFDYVLSLRLEGEALRERRPLPGDAAYYAWCVRWHTGTELTPHQVHELGVAEVERLEARIDDVASRRGLVKAETGAPAGSARPWEPPFSGTGEIRRVGWDGSGLPMSLAGATEPPRRTWAQYAIREAAQGKARAADFAAYRDGLALYAAHFAQQAGVSREPLEEIAQLRHATESAALGVVDGGVHEQSWTRDQAQAYLLAHSILGAAAAAAAIEHLLAHPGQALAAPIGLRKIIELRDRAAVALGAQFDLGQFHRELLGHGALPLGVLESAMDAWIARR